MSGSRINKINSAKNFFIECAALSPLNQMKFLVQEIEKSFNDELVESAIEKADKEWEKILNNASVYEKILGDAKQWT